MASESEAEEERSPDGMEAEDVDDSASAVALGEARSRGPPTVLSPGASVEGQRLGAFGTDASVLSPASLRGSGAGVVAPLARGLSFSCRSNAGDSVGGRSVDMLMLSMYI